MISQKQFDTIEHLKKYGKPTKEDQIAWCKDKMSRPRKHSRPNTKSLIGRRAYGRSYYQGIIDYLSNN
jgi:hypothetical protein